MIQCLRMYYPRHMPVYRWKLEPEETVLAMGTHDYLAKVDRGVDFAGVTVRHTPYPTLLLRARLCTRPQLRLNAFLGLMEERRYHHDQATKPRHPAKHATNCAQNLKQLVARITEKREEDESHKELPER